MNRVFVVLAAAALACGAFAAPAAGAGQKSARNQINPLGVTVVRFAKGTPAAEMQAIVAAAGGTVVTDLGRIDTIAATGADAGFAARVKTNAAVRSAFPDRLITLRMPPEDNSDVVTGKNDPQLGSPGPNTVPDPWHDLGSFLGETNPTGILQWDDLRMNVPTAWGNGVLGDRSVRVAVLDTGVQGSHKELLANYDQRTSKNMIPCNLLVRQFGPLGQMDCSSEDTEGHGTWVASRIAGAVNGFASNGVAPGVQVIGYKVLSTTLGGGLTTWIVAGMIDACDHDVDLINMSLGGYDDPTADADDYLLWVDAVNYCRAKGTAIFASAGNEHVRIDRVELDVGGVTIAGAGQVAAGNEGYVSTIPGTALVYLGGLLETPAGVPGVVMVSATNNAIGGSVSSTTINANAKALVWPDALLGTPDQLTYYSNYGARIDVAAPGGARKFNIPRYDVGSADILYGGWGSLGALDASGEICTDPASASLLTFACFKVKGAGFGWLQGTSMSSPNATGVAALTLTAHPELQGNPDGLLARLQLTARNSMVNYMGPNDPTSTAPSAAGVNCTTGWCHVERNNPIAFTDAYGAGIVNAGKATGP